MSRFLVGSSLLLISVVIASAQPPQAPAPRRIPIEELVEQLGTGPLAQREAAEARLSALAFDPPPPELLAALKSSGLDRRDRAARIIQAMRWNVVATKLPRGVGFAEQGRADLFVAATAVWNLKADDERLWTPAQALGRRLIEKAGMKGDHKPNCPASYRDFATYVKRFGPLFTRVDEIYTRPDPEKAQPPILYRNEAIQAPGVVGTTGIINNLIVSRGSVKAEKTIQASVVFANGDVTSRGTILDSVIVCDGDVTVLDGRVAVSLIVARGNISIQNGAEAATLIAGGKITLGAQLKLTPEHFNITKENEPNPLGYITFFDLHRVGLEAKAADKAVAITAVKEGSAGAKAGLKVGDVVVAVGAKKPTDPESLRRALRDALAVGDAALTVTRDGKAVEVKLALPE